MSSRKVVTTFFTACLLVSLSACNGKTSPTGEVLYRIDGQAVTLEQFRSEFERAYPADPHHSATERNAQQRDYLAQSIDRRLALREAARLGLTVTADELAAAIQEHRRDYPEGSFEESLKGRNITLEEWKRELADQLLMEKLARQVTASQIKIGEQEITGYYRQNREEFERPAQVRARQIVVAGEDEGKKLLAQLKQGKNFAELARQFSLSPDAEQGGDLGFFGRGEMPAEFDAVVFTLPVGKVSELVRSEYGFHLFVVEERRDAVRLSLAQVRDEIRQRLTAEKEEQAFRQWLDAQRGKAKIDVNLSLL